MKSIFFIATSLITIVTGLDDSIPELNAQCRLPNIPGPPRSFTIKVTRPIPDIRHGTDPQMNLFLEELNCQKALIKKHAALPVLINVMMPETLKLQLERFPEFRGFIEFIRPTSPEEMAAFKR